MAGTTTMPAGPTLPGIDVSHYQGAIEWKTVAAGVAFAYAKATEGLHSLDARFAANWAGMRGAGIPRGAYHFFRPAAAAEEQSDKFLSVVKGFAAGDLPPMLDLEEARGGAGAPEEWAGIPLHERLPLALVWLQQVEQALGVRPIIYTRRGWVQQTLGTAGELVNYPLWIAHYTNAAGPALPAGWPSWTFWQYSESGHVGGINGNVDLDRFNGSLDDLRALAKPAEISEVPVTAPPASPPAGSSPGQP